MPRLLLTSLLFAAGAAVAQPDLVERARAVQADPAARNAAIEAGRKASFFCANCHGETGIGKTPDVPNLAGQHPAYLIEQIRKFGAGERKDVFMQGLIKVLKDDERLQIALYFASNPVLPGASDPIQAARGKQLYGKHCQRCHGDQAHGDELIPRLAGQKVAYLRNSITRYRAANGVRNNPLMAAATSLLKDDEIFALANYLAQLP